MAFTTVAAFGADNSLGMWKFNPEKSKYTPSPMPLKSVTVTREASDGGVKVTTVGERNDGTKINVSYIAKYDGSPASVADRSAPAPRLIPMPCSHTAPLVAGSSPCPLRSRKRYSRRDSATGWRRVVHGPPVRSWICDRAVSLCTSLLLSFNGARRLTKGK